MKKRNKSQIPGEGPVNEVIVVEKEETCQLRMLVATCLALHVQVESINHPGQVVAQRLPPLSIRYHSK